MSHNWPVNVRFWSFLSHYKICYREVIVVGYPHTQAGVPEWVKGLPRYVYLSLWGGTVGDGEVMSQVSPAGQRWLESLPQASQTD